jgi:hypothetical protein
MSEGLRRLAVLSPNRLRDWLFFPLSIVLAIGLVALAISPALGRTPTGPMAGNGFNYNTILIDGAYLHKLYSGGDADIDVRKGDGGRETLEMTVTAGLLDEAPDLGPHFRLAADIEQQFSGRRVRVTVRAQPASDRGATQMRVNYSAGRVGESGWTVFDLKPGWNDFSFEYDVPVIEGDQGFDYIAIRPVVPEKTRTLLIDSVRLDRLPQNTGG